MDQYAKTNSDWVAAQNADGVFPSAYAQENRVTEDMAETFLLYLAVKVYPDRIGEAEVTKILEAFPNRFDYIDSLNIDLSVDLGNNQGDAFVALDDSFVFDASNTNGTYEGGVNLLSNDEGEGLFIYSVNGQVIGDGASVEMDQGGGVYVNSGGSIDFDANGEFARSGSTGFSYITEDKDGFRDEALVSIDVEASSYWWSW
jgi:hypothetical protein